eukprot:NODE_118_length_2613_cov_107.191070_g114_i0.p1 GENE.NODE_118_length_2613_cov_107.191070_g114_i0~~NODE_118_length_2613_cov_107.191070_g114_i0.p1  ORF type:complete len:860 (+),score=138.88 NODE_118_length_2613_cov_107.191070_g114_i0:326-2581(+)
MQATPPQSWRPGSAVQWVYHLQGAEGPQVVPAAPMGQPQLRPMAAYRGGNLIRSTASTPQSQPAPAAYQMQPSQYRPVPPPVQPSRVPQPPGPPPAPIARTSRSPASSLGKSKKRRKGRQPHVSTELQAGGMSPPAKSVHDRPSSAKVNAMLYGAVTKEPVADQEASSVESTPMSRRSASPASAPPAAHAQNPGRASNSPDELLAWKSELVNILAKNNELLHALVAETNATNRKVDSMAQRSASAADDQFPPVDVEQLRQHQQQVQHILHTVQPVATQHVHVAGPGGSPRTSRPASPRTHAAVTTAANQPPPHPPQPDLVPRSSSPGVHPGLTSQPTQQHPDNTVPAEAVAAFPPVVEAAVVSSAPPVASRPVAAHSAPPPRQEPKHRPAPPRSGEPMTHNGNGALRRAAPGSPRQTRLQRPTSAHSTDTMANGPAAPVTQSATANSTGPATRPASPPASPAQAGSVRRDKTATGQASLPARQPPVTRTASSPTRSAPRPPLPTTPPTTQQAPAAARSASPRSPFGTPMNDSYRGEIDSWIWTSSTRHAETQLVQPKTNAELYAEACGKYGVFPAAKITKRLGDSRVNELQSFCADDKALPTPASLAVILDVAKQNTFMMSLSLQNCKLTDAHAQQLMTFLKAHPTVGYVRLDHNRITDEGARLLQLVVQATPRLHLVSLEGNPISDKLRTQINKQAARNASSPFGADRVAAVLDEEFPPATNGLLPPTEVREAAARCVSPLLIAAIAGDS